LHHEAGLCSNAKVWVGGFQMYASILGLMAVLSAVPAEPTAVEQRYFQMFDSLCLSTLGEPDAAQAAAEAAGWTAMPQSIIDEIISADTPVVRGRFGPSLVENGPPTALLSATATMPDGMHGTSCVIDPTDLPAMDAATLEALVTTRLGLSALQSPIGPIWGYSGSGPYVDELPAIMGGEAAMYARARVEPFAMVQIETFEGRPYLDLTRMNP
jgi:hypothetical protein